MFNLRHQLRGWENSNKKLLLKNNRNSLKSAVHFCLPFCHNIYNNSLYNNFFSAPSWLTWTRLSVQLSIIYKKLGISFPSLFFFFFYHLLLVVFIFTVLQGRRRGLLLLFHRSSGTGLFLGVCFSCLALALYAVELTFYSHFISSLGDISGIVHFSHCKHQDRVFFSVICKHCYGSKHAISVSAKSSAGA